MDTATEGNNNVDPEPLPLPELQNNNQNEDAGSSINAQVPIKTEPQSSIEAGEGNQVNNEIEEDGLEEGELKDDDDDDEEDENEEKEELAKSKSSSSEQCSPERPASSSSSSSSMSSSASSSSSSDNSKAQSSSKSSSRIGSHRSSSSRNNIISYDRQNKIRLSSSRHISEDRFRVGREKEREDPAEKAAKLISMRAKLLEARSREIELKFQKNKVLASPPPALLTPCLPKSVKMTIAKPSIQYNENPNPTYVESPTVSDITKKSKPKPDGKEKEKDKEKEKEKEKEKKKKKSKKKKKKRKSSSKKHKKHKSDGTAKKSSASSIDNGVQEPSELPYDKADHQGPRTPPDNHVTTLDDVQIEWPSHLIRMTLTQPSITYSVNPASLSEPAINDRKVVAGHRRKKSDVSPNSRKKHKSDEKRLSAPTTPPLLSTSPSDHRGDIGGLSGGYSAIKPSNYDVDLNSDFTWYYNYFVDSLEMDHNQAQHQAYCAVILANTNEKETLEKWLNSRNMSKLSNEYGGEQKEFYPFSLKEEAHHSSSPVGSQTSSSFIKLDPTNNDTVDRSNIDPIIKTVLTRISRNQVIDHSDYQSETEVISQEKELENNVKTEASDQEEKFMNSECLDQESASSEPIKKEEEGEEEDATDKSEDKTHQQIELLNNTVTLRPIQPKFTIIQSQKEVVLPNGQVLPPGTVQKIVHPYPRIDSELLGPQFDFY